MASTCPSPSILPSSSSSTSSATPLQFSSAGEANSYRLKAIVERLNFIMKVKGTIRFDSSEFFNLCFALARGVDYALTINDVPGVAHRLPFLMKEVYQRRKDISLQPAIMVLMISVKNACKNGWFISADADELLSMTNELFNSFCMTINATPQLGNALDIVLKLASRFYPELKLGSLLVSLEAKPGYEILMSDFQIPRNIPPEEKIRLIVVKTDNLETSSCIISPPQVSFMVNGKGVDRRTNVSQDGGPQFPTDITKMLKYGTNIVQAVGYFSGTYLIALAFMTKIVPFPAPILQDYVQPVVSAVGSDSEIIEGASRITLNCPISFRRIKTPVKGHLCKHHQCFDYDNFMEMNSRRPSWRCPFCNQPVSFIDLRIDQNMIKILKEVGEDVVDVIISAEGSWRAAIEPNGNKDQLPREKLKGQQYCSIIESASGRSFANTLADPVDLTVGEEDGKSDVAVSPNQVESINDAVSRSDNHSCEVEDTKPFKDAHYFHVQKFLAERPLTNNPSMTTQPPLSSQLGNVSWPRVSSSSLPSSYAFSRLLLAQTAPDACVVGNAETTVLPASLENSLAIVSAVSPVRAPNEEDLTDPEPSETNFTFQQLSQDVLLAENMQLEARIGNSIISQEIERLPIPRHVNRNPIAVQALPVQLQSQSQSQPEPEPLNSFKRMRINGPNTVPMISNDLSSATYKTIQSVASIPDAHIFATDSEMQVLRTSGQSMSQNMDHQHIQSLPPSAATAAAVATSTTSVASSSFLQRGVGAYRAAAATAAALHQSPSSSLPQPSEHHRNLSTLGRNHHASLISTYRSKTALPLGATRELARQVSHQRVRMQQGNGGGGVAGAVPVNSASQPSTPPPPGVAASELTADQNWRPTGRMRGSLTGSAYSAALSHYLAAPTTQRSQPTPAPAPAPRPSISPLDTVTTSRQHNDDMGS